ncbi:probable indole-3-pyruvate monooxygenase YUCCA4 [Cynara cardunculus var. scolymus]|uniref:probable indole-3-pyruvate monooxygenase YUCCA4 n=1 Tax=Cynara cardunculus var. scolymus TaxID=59895 RepID=UPI000D625865|nr:probable indole-3-pyruvate monooxygenase YUCCA4 [Cynara cardunculus var. scolymus]
MGSTQKDEIFIKVHGPIIVGAGPSGIAVAACLKENGIPSLVLERSDCIASLWQYKTYNIVKLHLPKKLCELPLLGYPKNFPTYPTRDQFIAYITAYADHFKIKPMFNQTVESAVFEFERGVWRVKTQDSGYESRWLVVATGENAEALVPEIPGLETFEGPLLHASEYKNGYEFKDKRVLVVGCGNSGMEISLDLCNHKAIPFIVVRSSVHVVPREMFGFSTFGVAMTLLKWLPIKLVDKIILSITKHILGDIDKFGIRRPKTGPMELKLTSGRTPVVDVGALSEVKTGNIKVVEQGVKEISKNGVKLMDGQELECDCIVLATGYKSNVPSWLKGCDFFTDKGIPKTPFPNGWKGENGLYAIGFTNRGLFGAAYDATRIGKDINKEWWAMDDFEFEFPSY